MLLGSLKARDLVRDPRVLVHDIVRSRDGTTDLEFILRGRAVLENDPQVNEAMAVAIAAELPWQPEAGKFHLFRIDIEDVASIRWGEHKRPVPDDLAARAEQVRRGTSATSVGPAEPHSELLD
jgi:hypothetical protein